MTIFRRSLRARFTAILLFMVLVPLVVVSMLLIWQARRALEANALQDVQLVTDLNVQATQRFLAQFEADLLSLSQTPPVQAIIRARDGGGVDPIDQDSYGVWVSRLGQIFISFVESKPFYQQLRYLDEGGQELVRVEFDGQQAVLISSATLQNKRERPYFLETMKLSAGEIYISELELNREQGRIQIPLTPVIRYAMPIFDPAGTRRGIVVLNIYADSFLSQLRQETGQTYLANQEGFYLDHPDSTHEFGFDLGTDFTIQQEFQEALKQVEKADTAVGVHVDSTHVATFHKIRFDPRQPERYWLLAYVLPKDEIFTEINVLTFVMLGIVGGTAILVVMIAFWVVRSITEPINLLATASQQITAGNLDVSLPISREDEIGVLAVAFTQMANQVQNLVGSLEQRVADRTQQLELAATLTESLTALLHLDNLLITTVNEIKDTLNYYHTHIYLLDDNRDNLVVVQGTGDAGAEMKAQGHKIGLNNLISLVARAARTKQVVWVDNVYDVDDWLPNPLLPDTRSEMAVPIVLENQVVGVLDVQQNGTGRLDESDATVLRSIANQIGIAIHNAKLYGERQDIISQLQAVDKAKSRFITMVSHELRTPLHAINGFTELLLMGLSGEVSDEAKEDIQRIYTNGQHLLSLINDIIDITQIEQEAIEIKPERLDLEETVGDVLGNVDLLLGDKAVEVVLQVKPDLPQIWADPIRLKQVLFNLVSNAIKFTDEGQITIAANLSDRSSDKVKVTVKDTGIGIPADKLEQIFGLFQQADMTDARQYGGLGVGLSVCKMLVDLQGGEIGVSSEEGVGSQFWFTMPLANQQDVS